MIVRIGTLINNSTFLHIQKFDLNNSRLHRNRWHPRCYDNSKYRVVVSEIYGIDELLC